MCCRERASKMYSVIPYSIASSFVEFPYLLVQTAVFSPIVFFLVGFTNEGGWEFWYFTLMIFLMVTMYTFLGQLLACASPSQQVAMVLAGAHPLFTRCIY